MIDWPTVQTRLGVKPDNQPGRVTYGALLSAVARKPVSLADPLGFALSLNAPAYQIDANPYRLAAFLGETCHETQGFQYLREIWGPTDAQKRYDAPGNKLGNGLGDGYRYKGRGLIQLTGRANYADFGRRLGLDLINHPELVEQSSGAVMTALEYWKLRNLNALADTQDWRSISIKINGGTNGLDQRAALINRALGVLA